jgi:hypothetical protein
MTRSNLTAKSHRICPKQLVQIDRVVFLRLSLLGIFLIKKPIEKTMNCSSEYKKQKKVKIVTL